MQIARGKIAGSRRAPQHAQHQCAAAGPLFRQGDGHQGGKPQGHIVRPFRVVPASTADGGRRLDQDRCCRSELLGSMLSTISAGRQEGVARAHGAERGASAPRKRPARRPRPRSRRRAAARSGRRRSTHWRRAIKSTAAFLRGVDFFAQGQNDRAMQQLQIAMQGAPTFAPARLVSGRRARRSQPASRSGQPAAERLGRRRRSGAGRHAWRD